MLQRMDMCNVEGSKKGGRPRETGIATSQSGPGRTRYREWTCVTCMEGSKKGGRPRETGIATSQSGPGRTRYREWTCVTWRGQRREGGPVKLA